MQAIAGLSGGKSYYFYYVYKNADSDGDDDVADEEEPEYGPVTALSFTTLWSKPTIADPKELTHNSAKVSVTTGVPSGTKALLLWFVKKGKADAITTTSLNTVLTAYSGTVSLLDSDNATIVKTVVDGAKTVLAGLPGQVASGAAAATSAEAALTKLTKKTEYTMYAAFVTADGNHSLMAMKSFTTKDETKETWDRTKLGLADASDVVYPNPTSGVLHVPVSDGHVQVYGTDGSSVGSLAVEEGLVDMSALPAGVYLLKVSGQTVRVVKN